MSSLFRSAGVSVLVGGVLLLSGCKGDPAPADADGALRWLYENYATADAAALSDAVVKLNKSLPMDDLPIENTMDHLTVAAIADVELAQTNDPSKAQGILIVTMIPCTLASIEKLHTALDQNTIHHGAYDKYVRAYTSSAEDYFARKTDRLTWQTDYTVSALGSSYDATIKGGVRFVTATDDKAVFPFGSFFAGRAVLPKPAVFKDGGADFFRQDYQLDLYYPRSAKETLHVFGVWRDMHFATADSSDALFIQNIQGKTVDTDQEVADICSKE